MNIKSTIIEENPQINEDSEYENEINFYQGEVKNQKIPACFLSPSPSQTRLINLKKVKSKTRIDIDSINESSHNIYNFNINSNKSIPNIIKENSSTENTPKRSQKLSLFNKIQRPYSYRRPFSKFKRKLIFFLLCIINIIINFDHGAIPACTTEIKIENNLSNIELGVIGSAVYLGLILGSLSAGYFFSTYSNKWLVILTLFISSFFLYSFTIIQGYGGLGLCRIICGFSQVFCYIYFPVWVDQYGVNGYKTLWLTFLQLGIPVGSIIGYIVEALMIKYYDNWRNGFYIQIFFICFCNCIFFLTPDKFFERNYRHSETTQEEMQNEFILFKDVLSKKLGRSNNDYLLRNMNLINDVYNSKYGRPSLYSIFSMIDVEDDENTKSYFYIIKNLIFNKKYMLTMLSISCNFFVVTGIQFWISDYMQEVLNLSSSKAYLIYTIVYASALTSGVLSGGIFIQYLGGYTNKKALEICFKLSFCNFICAFFLQISTYTLFFIIFMWLVLFLSGSITPGLSGIVITSIPDNSKEVGNSFTQLCYNLIGYLPSPFVYGFISSCTGGKDSKWGLSAISLWSLLSVACLFFARKVDFDKDINVNLMKLNDNIIDNNNNNLENSFMEREHSILNEDFSSLHQSITSKDLMTYYENMDNRKHENEENNNDKNLENRLNDSWNKDNMVTKDMDFKGKTNMLTSLFGRPNQL